MNKKGVTLVELVVVMVIIAIAAALAVPNIAAWLPNYRLRTATRDIVSTMRTAQMKAVANNTEYRVLFNPQDPYDECKSTTNSYIIQVHTSSTANATSIPRQCEDYWSADGAVQPLPKGIVLQGIDLPGNNAQFNSNSTSSSGNVVLTNSKNKGRQIILYAATGRVRVVEVSR